MEHPFPHEHSPEAIRVRLEEGPAPSYVRDWVYGGMDGTVTTFAVVSGVVGARMGTHVILILGIANLLADGFSMAASNYSGTKAELEELEHVRAAEEHQVRVDPDGERAELREIFRRKGFGDPELERMVEVIAADPKLWVRTMLTEEYGLPLQIRSPFSAAVCTMSAFVLCGSVPLFPYVIQLEHPFVPAAVGTALTFFLVGSAKSRWTIRRWWTSGLESLVVGGIAASIAYGLGWMLRGWVPA